ncbi:hypothetical protein [uncultured Chryseobacterium sp.]|uniref:hypothetical protein n=1 Tax=uncultured Chryseobacterium sp. TaxID=259322 RepID=UPI0025D40B9F|nr:hypothetical protein [uncultured Chryseobacterium sp.]
MKKQGKKEIATKILGKNVLSNVYGGKYLISNYMHDGKPVSDSWNDANNDGLWNPGEKGIMIYDGEIVSGPKH